MKKIILLFLFSYTVAASFAADPTVQASNILFTGYGTTTLSFSWTRGNGDYCLVVVHPYSTGTSYPVDGTSYVSSSTYGNGTNLGNTNYVVAETAGSSMTVYGLTSNTRYSILIYEYEYTGFFYKTPGTGNNHYTLDAAPTVQATALTASSITSAGATLSWTSGNGVYELVSARQSTANANLPADGNLYTASTTFGSGSSLGSFAPYSYVTYSSSGNAVGVIGCAAATDYVANCVTYNGGSSGAQNYLLTSYPTVGFTTLAAQPTGNCNSAYFTDISESAMTLHWVRPVTGGGSKVLVTIRASAGADLPVDQNNYTANTVYGSGSLIGSSYVVYAGNSNTVRVTGLATNTRYYVAIVEYNGGVGTYNSTNNYNTSYLTGSQYTLPAEPTTTASNLSFSNIQTNQVTATWTNGNGNYRVVGVRPSRIQTALAFDGTDDYVGVPYNAALQPATAMTLEAWSYKANWTGTGGWQTIAGNYETKGYQLFSYNSDIYGYVYRNGYTEYVYYNVSYLTSGWHHFAMTYDGRYLRLYVDGAEKDMADGITTNSIEYTYANNLIIGADAGIATTPTANYFNGYIDEVRLWNVAQPVGIIRANMIKSMLGYETGLAGAWSMNDGFAASTIAANSSLNATTLQGTLNNFASTVAATSFTGTSGWIKSGATVDLPIDFTYYSGSTAYNNGAQIGNKYHSVYWGSGSTVTVMGLTPGTYYDFVVAENNNTGWYDNYQTSTYLMGDVQTAAQPVPTIVSFAPTSGTVGTIVTITGTNFDITSSNNIVHFGATKATVISSTAAQMIVIVPYCANYVPISVQVNSVSGVSRNPFVVTNACSATISTPASFTASTYTTGTARAGTAAKDIDGDGKSDLLYNDYMNNTFSIVRNQSSNGSINWASAINYVTNTGPIYMAVGDVDGDTKPDVIVGCNGSVGATIDIFRNTSTSGSISFASKIQIPSSSSPSTMRLADFDNDGKLDIAVGHISGGIVSIYRNTSSKGFISFDNRLDLPALGDSYTIDIGDMNGDNKIDLIVGDRTNNNISFFQNTSTLGVLSCAAVVNLAPGSSPQSIAVGDMDNDGRPDVCTGLANGTIRVYKNNNSGGAVSSGNFALQTTLTTLASNPYGLIINDLDGDGRNDLICGYSLVSTVSLFEQTGTFVFSAKVDFAGTGTISYFLSADDFSLDGKTDIITANFGSSHTFYNSNINALASEPVGASSGINITGTTQTTFNITFTAGGGVSRIVVVKPSAAVQVFPSDGVGYTANSDYTLGADLGGGNKVVYNGNSNSVSVTGLTSNTTYNVYVYEYNGATCTANYLTNPFGTNSANTQNTPPTLNNISNPSPVCQSSGQQAIGLTGIGTGGEVQPLSVAATSSNTVLIPNSNISIGYTSPSAVGTVSFTPVNGQSGSSVITVTVNDGASNNNTIQKTFTVSVTASPTVANAGSNVTICSSATNLAGNTPVSGSGAWTFVYTSNPSIAITNTISATSQIAGFNAGDSVRLAWTIANSPCSPSGSNVSVKRIACPLNAEFIADQTSFCGTSAIVNFSDLSTVPVPNSIVYWSWSFPGGAPSTYTTSAGVNPPPVTYTASGTYSVSLYVEDNDTPTPSNNTEAKNNYITITPFPGTATTINGSATICQGQTGVTYSVTPVAGANTYSWTVPSGGTIIGTANTNTISVNFSVGATAGNISVTGQNACGNGSAYNQAIAVNNLPGATGVIAGPTSACQGQNGVVFSVGAIAGSTGYNWTLPAGASIVAGVNTNSVTVNFSPSATDGTVDVNGTNSCGSGSSSSAYGFSIDSLPLPAGTIYGTTSVCPNDTVIYSIFSLGYASTYVWTLPSGASIIAGANTETVTVAYAVNASAGNITVKGVNACGNGTIASVAITVNPLPDAATSILVNSGNTTVCAGSTAISCFVSAIPNATGYNWILPAGFTIYSGTTNAILVSVSPTASSGTVSVNGTNACGNGVSASVAVTVSPLPGFANTITGSATVCQSQSGVVYIVPAITFATGYNWTLPLGASIVGAANTNTITVDFSNTVVTGTITVAGTNSCGDGLSVDSFPVTVNPLPDAAGLIDGDITITICPVQTSVSYSVAPVNNAADYSWSVPSGAVIASGNNTNAILVNYSDTAVSGNISVIPTNACGNGVASNLNVGVDTVQSQSICIATVDSTSTKNFLIWEKPVSTSIDSFFIYREITSVYTKIGSVDYSDVSEFMDNTNGVNPKTTSYKYKLSVVDACGNESYLSEYHRTIHLQVAAASPCGYNLQWTDYEGFPVTKYRIMRDTLGTGVYHAADSVSFGTTTWTDIKCYLVSDTIGYYIEITHPGGSCVSSIKNPDIMTNTNLNLSKSNINRMADTTLTGVAGINDNYVVLVYPNPNDGLFTLELNQLFGRGEVVIFNMLGEAVKNLPVKEKDKKIRINLNGYAKGVYQVQVKCENIIINKKIILQ
ncbi:MAG: T9SS type A sorting domain-containing protein [Bacteroidetes bacterium]|nr:MAG: T9SS type A sorting domain-containing protein [Bacteroidota bacterium]